MSKPALKKPDNFLASFQDFKLRPKSCDRFWIRRRIVENKTHPIVTIYNSKAGLKIRARDDSFKTDQAKLKKKDSEIPPIDFICSEDNPNAIIEYPSKVLLVQVQSSEANSEKFKRTSGKDSKQRHRFSYLSKELTFGTKLNPNDQ